MKRDYQFNEPTWNLLQDVLADGARSVLDAGAGTCATSLFLAQNGFHVVACDRAFPLEEGSSFKVTDVQGTLKLVRCNLASTSFLGHFDVVLMLGVLHYAQDPAELEKMLATGVRSLRSGGRLGCSWICSTSPDPTVRCYYPSVETVSTLLAAEGLHLKHVSLLNVHHIHGEPHCHEMAYTAWAKAAPTFVS